MVPWPISAGALLTSWMKPRIALSPLQAAHRRSITFANIAGIHRVIPEHALHEKGLQRHKGVGALVSSQAGRTLFVPRIYRWSTAGFVPPSVSEGGCLFVLPESRSKQLRSTVGRARKRLFPGRTDPSASRPSPLCPAPPPAARWAAPTRPWYEKPWIGMPSVVASTKDTPYQPSICAWQCISAYGSTMRAAWSSHAPERR